MSAQKFDHTAEDGIRELFVGRSIVSAVDNVLTLDDGTQIELRGNSGSWGSSSGNYMLDQVSIHPNLITGVALASIREDETRRTYKIFVYTGAIFTEVASFAGDDGSGWYGTGYTLEVVEPSAGSL